MTKKETIMKMLLDGGASPEQLKWVGSYLPNTNEAGNIVPEGLTFNNFEWHHNKEALPDVLGMNRMEQRGLIRKLEDISEEVLASFGEDGFRNSYVIEKVLKQANPKEFALLVTSGVASVLKGPREPRRPSMEGFMDFLKKMKPDDGE